MPNMISSGDSANPVLMRLSHMPLTRLRVRLSLRSVGTVAFDGFLVGVDNFFRFESNSEPPVELRLIRSPACKYSGEWEDLPEGIKVDLLIRWADAECFLSTDFSQPLWQEGMEPLRVQ
jgi:hypothetical protein